MRFNFKAFGLLTTSLAVLVLADPAIADWTTSSHPCVGDRTNALHRDNDGTLWVGCGTTVNGTGLFFSVDNGQIWDKPQTDPAAFFDDFRVNDITRGHDGALYAAGRDTLSSARIMRLDTSTAPPWIIGLTLDGTPSANFEVGTYRELADGRALAESQTGFDKLYRPNPGVGSPSSNWLQPAVSIEPFTQMIVHNDQLYASGSRLAIPPRVFLPPQTPGAEPWEFVQLILDSGYDGEMWGIAVNNQRVVAVGVDQDENIGKIFISDGDPYNASNYRQIDLPDIIGSGGLGTWARGVCMRDNWIAVVGERQPLGSFSGQVMVSSDGGQTFQDIKPAAAVSTVSKCVITPTGLLIVAGSGGFVGRWDGMLLGDKIFGDRFLR